jgi:toxin CcdB
VAHGPPKQFDVYRNPDRATAASHPYLIVLQSDLLPGFNTRIVAPLIPPKKIPFFEHLMPTVAVAGTTYVIDPVNMGVVPVKTLTKPVTNLETERQRIVAAIDLLFTGI